MAKFSFLVSFLLATSPLVAATEMAPFQNPKQAPVLNTPTPQGCFRSLGESLTKGDAKLDGKNVSSGACIKFCKGINKPVAALGPQDCYCGDTYPAKGDLADDSKCNSPCPAYGLEACGSVDHAFSVWNTGLRLKVEYDTGKINDGRGDKNDDKTTTGPGTVTETATATATATTNVSSSATTANSPPDGIATASGKADATTTPGFHSTQSAAASAITGNHASAGSKQGSSVMMVAAAAGVVVFL